MKRKFLVLLFLLAIGVSCKNETSKNESNYPDIRVGAAQGTKYTVTATDIIKPVWEKHLKGSGTIDAFEIVKTSTTGDTIKDCYVLVGKCNDGKTIAALLQLKGNDFYFDESNPVTVTCHGECPNGCLPIATANNGAVFLACSPCPDCIKTDHSL